MDHNLMRDSDQVGGHDEGEELIFLANSEVYLRMHTV